jgi:hypothetical protein
MNDGPTLEPALTAEEWKSAFGSDLDDDGTKIGEGVFAYIIEGELMVATEEGNAVGGVHSPEKLLGLANAALPDDDPRRITRERVRQLRFVADHLVVSENDAFVTIGLAKQGLRSLADALESYLIPE